MAAEYTFDLDKDFSGNHDHAFNTLEKLGYDCKKYIDPEANEHIINFLETNNIPYSLLYHTRYVWDDYFVIKNENNKQVSSWLLSHEIISKLFFKLTDYKTLMIHTRLNKHGQEKLRKLYLKCYYDLTGKNYTCPFITNHSFTKLINAILLSYKNNGFQITSIKDFLKIIEISTDKAHLRIKFLDEAQAADFVFRYGVELH